MALDTNTPITAWGSVHAFLGAVGSGDTMGAVLDDLGYIDENALSIETQEGTTYELKDINGQVIDELKQSPKLTVNFTLIKPSEAIRNKFWNLEEIGTGDARKINVKSLVTNTKYSFKFANVDLVGSETFEAPLCSVNMVLRYDPTKGWLADCSITILKGQTEVLFSYGLVTSSTPLVVTPASLSFTSAADTTGKTLTATSTGNIVATNNGSYWIQLTYTGKVATIKVPANPNTEARTGTVTIVADGKTANIEVTQAGA